MAVPTGQWSPLSGDLRWPESQRRSPWRVVGWVVLGVMGVAAGLVALGVGVFLYALSHLHLHFDLGDDCSQSNLPLNQAVAANDNIEVVDQIRQGADPNRIDTSGRSALDCAVPTGFSSGLQQAAGSAGAPDTDGRALTMVAALLSHGAKPDGTPLDRPVVNALWAGDPMTAALLIRHADVRLPYGHTDVRVADAALAVAAQDGETAVARTLLARGADPNRTDLMTPLMRASFYGHDDVVATLLTHGANPKEGRGDQDICFGPPLGGIQQGATLATAAGVCASLDRSTPVSGPTGSDLPTAGSFDLDGTPDGTPFRASPVSAAVAGGHLSTLRLLLAHGAHVDGPALGNVSALSLAVEACEPRITAELVAHHATITASDRATACGSVAAVLGH
jgi:hypothetical protein